jgi:agmatine/peptidylarginine deiminase
MMIAGAGDEGDFRGRRFYFIVDEEEEAEARARFEKAGVGLDRVRFLRSFGTVVPDPVPPEGPVRLVAEWEPALGAVVSWPLKIPDELLVEIARDDTLFVLVKPEHATAAAKHVAGLGIDEERVRWVPSDVDSAYPRDFGPHQILDGEGRLAVLDTMFSGWPTYSAEPERDGLEWSTLYFEGPGDEDAPLDLARELGLPAYRLPAILTGGNFLVDGAGTAFCTRALVDENRERMDYGELAELVERYAGIERFVVLENTEGQGIQHIDCWMKVLDRGRLLVKRAPEGHPEAARIEANLELVARTPTASGRPWEILRVDCPPIGPTSWNGEAPLAAYTNSLILNGRVLVPLFGIEGDEAALETWRAALPGHRVVGIRYDDKGGWRSFDALHCRARAIFDPGMLRIVHDPVRTAKAGEPVRIAAEIDDRSGAGLVEGELAVHHRPAGADTWTRTPLEHGGGDRWTATLPALEAGAEVEYHLVARDRSGRAETHPRTAPAGAHRFVVSD